jgi:integrase
MSKPFFWEARNGWYVKVPVEGSKKKSNRWLANNERDAWTVWDQITSGGTGESLSVAYLLSMYLDYLEDRVSRGLTSPGTLVRRREYIAEFLVHGANETVSISDLRPYHVTGWLQSKPTWGQNTRHHAAAAIKSALQWCVKEGRVKSNPLDSLSVTKGDPRSFMITRDLFLKLWEASGDSRFHRRRVTSFRSILLALRLSGARPGEVTQLRVEDVPKPAWQILEHKNRRKTRKPRMIYPSPCLQTLAAIHAHGRVSGPLFLANDKEPWTYSKIRRRFERLRKRAKAPKECVAYSFRHTSITDLLVSGVDAATVAELHGTSITMIDRHYGHLYRHVDHLTKSASKAISVRNRS